MFKKIKLKILMRVKYLINYCLYLYYKYDSWHLSSIESREYCLDAVNYINSKIQIDGCAIEIGCGLGETISKINCKSKFGYDLSDSVIAAAKFRNYFNSAVFHVGSFDALNSTKVDYLIALNFLHDFDSKTVSKWFKDMNNDNDLFYIIVDEVHDPDYKNNHNFTQILPTNFIAVSCFEKEYRYNRKLKLFKNTNF